MSEHTCPKCRNKETEMRQKGKQTGLYCKTCGRWIKWLGKRDVRQKVESCENCKRKDGSRECYFCNKNTLLKNHFEPVDKP